MSDGAAVLVDFPQFSESSGPVIFDKNRYLGKKYRKKFDIYHIMGYNMKSVDAGWSSLEARRAHNPKVAGSNPAPATKRQRPHGCCYFSICVGLNLIK